MVRIRQNSLLLFSDFSHHIKGTEETRNLMRNRDNAQYFTIFWIAVITGLLIKLKLYSAFTVLCSIETRMCKHLQCPKTIKPVEKGISEIILVIIAKDALLVCGVKLVLGFEQYWQRIMKRLFFIQWVRCMQTYQCIFINIRAIQTAYSYPLPLLKLKV